MLRFLLPFLFLPFITIAQPVVTTITPQFSGIEDALLVDSVGNIYGSQFWKPLGGPANLYKLDTAGNISVFSSGFNACNGLAFDHQGRLYAVNYASSPANNQIYRLDSTGNKTPYGPKIFGASNILFDPLSDTLLVAQYGQGALGNRISKLAPDSTLLPYCSHPDLNGPVGMAFDENQNLYVANFTDAKVFQVTHGGDSLKLLADLPHTSFGGAGFMIYFKGELFVTNIGVHKIFKVDLAGGFSEFGGTGVAASIDGNLDTAAFNRPNGIAASQDGSKLYIADFGTETVREISNLDTITHIEEISPQQLWTHLSAWPNPARESIQVSYRQLVEGEVRLELYSLDGKLLKTLVSDKQPQGYHQHQLLVHNLTPGIYLGRLRIHGFTQSIRFCVIP